MSQTNRCRHLSRAAAISAAISAMLIADVSFAQPVIYPAGGQSAELQAKDDAECRAWATGNTGVDPAALASQAAQQQSELAQQAAQPAAQPQPKRGGAAKGAVAGAVVGEIVSDDAGKGAAWGAAGGAVAQRRRNVNAQQQAQAQQQQQQQQVAQQQQAIATNQQEEMERYYRAFGACMSGRGYTVN